MVKTRKGHQKKTGGRSGVVIEKTDDSNVDGWFDSARSPEVNAKQNALEEDSSVQNEKEAGKKTKPSKSKKVKTPKNQVRMSLGGPEADDSSREGRDSTSAKKYAAKLRRKGGTGVSFASPSDLSRVSTAAFSTRSEEKSDAGEDEKIDASSRSNQESDSDVENALLTQDDQEEEELAVEDDVIARQSARGNVANLEVASPEADFPAGEDDGEDDLGPPVLPNDFSNEDDKDEGEPKETKMKANDNDIDGLESNDENNDYGDQNDYGDDGDEGPGFNMVHDPETPLTVREERVKNEMQKIREERRKQRKENNLDSESEKDNDDEDEAGGDSKATPKVETSKKLKNKKKRAVLFSPKGIPIANRDYETVPIGALVEGSPQEGGPRRSRRARVKPLEFWRGEKMEYGAHNERGYIGKALGDMPVVTGIQKALNTPYKKRKPSKTSSAPRKGSKKNGASNTGDGVTEEEFNSTKLRRRFKYHDGEEAYLWDDITDDTADQKVVAYTSNMEGSALPISKKRKKMEGKVTGKAAQAFNIPNDDNDDYVGYIMGNLTLPPKGIKDSESVGPCSQTFTVVRCQPKAFEVAYGDPDQPDGELDTETAQRFLLSPGDMFRVPPGNSYRLENHSEFADCLLTWTIIRPRSVLSEPS